MQFLLENKVSRQAVDEVIKRGYTSLQALRLIDIRDLDTPVIPLGQRRLIPHVASAINTTPGNTTSNTEPNNASHAFEERHRTQQTTDTYDQLVGTLLSQQQRLGASTSTATQGFSQSTTASCQSAAQPSWADPQIHIATAYGKSAPTYLDICDFVTSNVEEELIIGSHGDQQILVKSGPRKPKLENLTLSQWSVANLSILYKLSRDGKLIGQSLMDYLSYTTKVYQLVQRYNLISVFLYDREYRKLQASEGFRWGTDVQHLHQINLQPREKSQTAQSQVTKKIQASGSVAKNSHGNRPEKRDLGICRNFNSTKGCTFPQCKYKHQCILPGCSQKHSAVTHMVEKN
ncbi:MAG: hypothetical protein AB2693_21565 [Candidatus Thiodiazotropha sp.]